jgi:putative transposase
MPPGTNFKFKNKLCSLDATVVSLCLSLFPWASCRRAKAGLKFHTLLNHDVYLPTFVAIAPAREHEVKKTRALNLPKGSIVVEDLGYQGGFRILSSFPGKPLATQTSANLNPHPLCRLLL